MSVRPFLLIDGPRTGLPPVRSAILEELHRLKERRGEMIAGYGFAWFDRLSDPANGGGAWYYVMKRVVTL